MPNIPEKQWTVILRDSTDKELERFYTDKSEYVTGYSTLEIGLTAGKYYIQIQRPSYGDSEDTAYQFYVFSPSSPNHFTEWEKQVDVSLTKEWTVTFNLSLDLSTIKEQNIYVTYKYGDVVPLLYIVDPSVDDSFIALNPVKPYIKGENYTLWIKDIKSKSGEVLKENVKMEFSIEN